MACRVANANEARRWKSEVLDSKLLGSIGFGVSRRHPRGHRCDSDLALRIAVFDVFGVDVIGRLGCCSCVLAGSC